MACGHQVERHYRLEGGLYTCRDTVVEPGKGLQVGEVGLVVVREVGEAPPPDHIQPGEGRDQRTEEQAEKDHLDQLPPWSLAIDCTVFFISLYCTVLYCILFLLLFPDCCHIQSNES